MTDYCLLQKIIKATRYWITKPEHKVEIIDQSSSFPFLNSLRLIGQSFRQSKIALLCLKIVFNRLFYSIPFDVTFLLKRKKKLQKIQKFWDILFKKVFLQYLFHFGLWKKIRFVFSRGITARKVSIPPNAFLIKNCRLNIHSFHLPGILHEQGIMEISFARKKNYKNVVLKNWGGLIQFTWFYI